METQDLEFENFDYNVYENIKSFYDYELHTSGFNAVHRHFELFIILSIVIILSVIGNILVVVISVFYMRLRSLTIIFILNLALSDLLFTVGLVFKVYDHVWGLPPEFAVCMAFYVVSSAGFYSSIVFLVLMSIQRYTVVVHPPSGWKKGPCVICVLICAWVVSILAAFPVMARTVALPYSGHCTYRIYTAFIDITYKENIVFVCAFLFMGFCYIRILQTIFKSPTNHKHRTTGLVFLLVAMFFICWAPYNIVNFLVVLDDQIGFFNNQVLKHLNYTRYICHLLAFTRCCLNPVIYGLFGVIFRKAVREFLQKRVPSNSAQIRMVDLNPETIVNSNNQVPELDIDYDFF
ncbi:chemokine XC receptor 1-like [Pangasianodon hypophthalmus]|uniref:chemokine XC receptor 1-like n=1 Tax=Pangasianodon hypophthalmus TaxID=310915 RepID=UPI0023076D40|nr:chemokine XC receptor 1-like [Pangasianodon hypophthalmus]